MLRKIMAEPVSDTEHGFNVGWFGRIGFDLLAQVANVNVNGSFYAFDSISLQSLEKLETTT